MSSFLLADLSIFSGILAKRGLAGKMCRVDFGGKTFLSNAYLITSSFVIGGVATIISLL